MNDARERGDGCTKCVDGRVPVTIGGRKLGSTVCDCKLPHAREYAATILFDRDMENVLLIRNTSGMFAGLWNVIGGKVEATDISPHHAAARELYEESGYAYYRDLRKFENLVTCSYPSGIVLHVYYGVLEAEVTDYRLREVSEGTLQWFGADDNLYHARNLLAGEGNVPYFVQYARAEERKATR